MFVRGNSGNGFCHQPSVWGKEMGHYIIMFVPYVPAHCCGETCQRKVSRQL